MCIEKEIIRSIKEQKLENVVLVFKKQEAKIIVNNLKDIFVSGTPRVWWLSLKYQPKCFTFEEPNSFEKITNFFTNDEKVWWVIEDDEELLLQTNIKHIISIIADCPFFEYNIISLDQKKLLIENDHNEFLFIDLKDNVGNGR